MARATDGTSWHQLAFAWGHRFDLVESQGVIPDYTSCRPILKVLASKVWAHGVPEGHPTFSRKRCFCENSANGLLQPTTVYFRHKSHVFGRKFNEEPKYELKNTVLAARGSKFWSKFFFHKKFLESPETCRKKIWAKNFFDPTPSWPGPDRKIAVAWQKLGGNCISWKFWWFMTEKLF